jgi:hypothetical protein
MELGEWLLEMANCEEVDRDFADRYHHTETEITAEQARRLKDFLTRHNLVGQFVAEDAQGKR